MGKVIFFNCWNSGDIFLSREFVRDYIKKNPNNDYYYAHKNSSRLLLDIPEIKYMPLQPEMIESKKIIQTKDYLGLSTWIGRTWGYLLPGTGVVIEKLYERFNDIGFELTDGPYKYIPQIDPLYYKQDYDSIKLDQYEKKVLICNGGVWSCQAVNFDFTPIIIKLSETYKDHLFIVTQKTNYYSDNIICTDDLFGMPMNDLNEIGCISNYCQLLVGRNSGPHTFSQNYTNWMDKNKILLSFTTMKENSSIIYSDHLPMRKVWCPETDLESVYNKIVGEMERIGRNE